MLRGLDLRRFYPCTHYSLIWNINVEENKLAFANLTSKSLNCDNYFVLRKKHKKNLPPQKHSKSFFAGIVSSLGILLLFTVVLSFTATSLGNKFLAQDNYRKASSLYTIASLLNPLNQSAQKGRAIAEVIKEERKGESEETRTDTSFDNKAIAVIPQHGQAVLGAKTFFVPILMYHYIRVNPYPSDRVGFNLSVTPDNFNAQMDYLSSHGYQTVSLDELGAALFSGASLPKKPIVITFDDGYKDVYTAAFPILKSHGMRAVSFVITGFVGGPNFLTWDMINEMKESGVFTFESHTVNHIGLTYASGERIRQELKDSKNTLQAHLRYPVNWVAYPYGNVNGNVASIAQQTGYVGALGTNGGRYQSANNMFTLPRVRIGGSDTVGSFAEKLP